MSDVAINVGEVTIGAPATVASIEAVGASIGRCRLLVKVRLVKSIAGNKLTVGFAVAATWPLRHDFARKIIL